MTPDRCTSAAVRAKHRRLADKLEDCADVVAIDLLEPADAPSGMWTTELVIDPRWASVPSHILTAIGESDLGIARAEPQGQPSHQIVEVR